MSGSHKTEKNNKTKRFNTLTQNLTIENNPQPDNTLNPLPPHSLIASCAIERPIHFKGI
jgi:hypothetical protein